MALVKSWLQGIPVPGVIVNARDNADWPSRADGTPVGGHFYGVVDGKQRIETAQKWFDGELAVPASWFPPDHIETTEETDDGPYVRHTGLTLTGQRLFANRAMLPVSEAQLGSVEEEAELYLLVNGGGTGQSVENMANAAAVARGK